MHATELAIKLNSSLSYHNSVFRDTVGCNKLTQHEANYIPRNHCLTEPTINCM